MRVQFVTIDRDTPDFLPASVQDYIAKNHLVWCLSNTYKLGCKFRLGI